MKNLTKLFISFTAIWFISVVFSENNRVWPDYIYPSINSGAINSDINQENINQNICKKGWSTKSIRPPVSYTNKIKKDLLANPKIKDKNPSNYELDHIISLELWWAPKDMNNLYLEPYSTKVNWKIVGALQKDIVENWLHDEICNKTITLSDAQKIIVQDWYACYLDLKSKKVCKLWVDNSKPIATNTWTLNKTINTPIIPPSKSVINNTTVKPIPPVVQPVINTSAPITPITNTITTNFSCSNIKKTCWEMNSCAEAKFYLNSCWVVKLDWNKDWTPCETLCK